MPGVISRRLVALGIEAGLFSALAAERRLPLMVPQR